MGENTERLREKLRLLIRDNRSRLDRYFAVVITGIIGMNVLKVGLAVKFTGEQSSVHPFQCKIMTITKLAYNIWFPILG